jgi:hypothetical protein
MNPAPLLKEECDTSLLTLGTDRVNPVLPHRSGSWTAFTSDDYPMNSVEADLAQVFK